MYACLYNSGGVRPAPGPSVGLRVRVVELLVVVSDVVEATVGAGLGLQRRQAVKGDALGGACRGVVVDCTERQAGSLGAGEHRHHSSQDEGEAVSNILVGGARQGWGVTCR